MSHSGEGKVIIAAMTRCAIPPESWCGWDEYTRIGSARPYFFICTRALSPLFSFPQPSRFRKTSVTCRPTRIKEFMAEIGSCAIQPMRFPRISFISFSGIWRSSFPSYEMLPVIFAFSGRRRMMAVPKIDFPLPDSPTSAVILPS